MAKMQLTGDRDLIANLKSIAKAFDGRTMDAVCEASLRPMEEQVKENARLLRQPGKAPAGGHLDEGVVTVKMASGGQRREFWISFRKRARKIAHLVEFGTRPHWQPRWRGGWMHPGARRKPFMRPAFEGKKRQVMDEFAKLAAAVINRSFKPVRKRR